MLQSLLSLEDDQIETVFAAVGEYCSTSGVKPESDEGRRAIQTAVNILSNRSTPDLLGNSAFQIQR